MKIPGLDVSKITPEVVDALKVQIASAIQESVTDLVTGAEEDVRLFGQAIANDTIVVLQIADEEKRASLLNEIGHQIKVLAEINRIRAVEAGWNTFEKVTMAVVKTAFKLLVPI